MTDNLILSTDSLAENAIHCGLLANSKQRMIELHEAHKLDEYVGDVYFLRLDMPCGEVLELKSVYDLPEHTLPCSCGNPNHFFVKYEDEIL